MVRLLCLSFALLLLTAPSLLARDITLEWDPNTEPDISGYKIYYRADSPALPLDGTGAREGRSPIDVGDRVTATIRGLDAGRIYYFAVTAYNSAGYESSLSNIVASDWVPVLLSPSHNAVADGNPALRFTWSDPPPELNVVYTLYYGTDPELRTAFAPPAPLFTSPGVSGPPPLTLPVAAALLTLLLISRARRLSLRRGTAALLGASLLLASCSAGGGDEPQTFVGAPAAGGSDPLFTVKVDNLQDPDYAVQSASLKSGTYYWKIVADDGEMRRESTVGRFAVR